jgi:hypothetical protein
LTQEVTAIENEKKAVVSEFKAKIDSKQAAIDSIGNHINNGYEHRYIECTTIFDEPSPGFKTTYRNDTKEKVSTAQMTADELQLAFDFQSGIETVRTDTPFDDPIVPEVEAVLGRLLKATEKANLKENIESGAFAIHGFDLKIVDGAVVATPK